MRKLKFVWNAPVTLSFVLLCIIALVLGYLTGGWTTEHLFMTYRSSLLSLLTYVRFFTQSRVSAGEYQADERAGVPRLSWRVSGR